MHTSEAVAALERDLRSIFGNRLRSLVVYGLRAQASQGDSHGSHAAHAYVTTMPIAPRGGNKKP